MRLQTGASGSSPTVRLPPCARYARARLVARKSSPSSSAGGMNSVVSSFFFQAEDGIRDLTVTGVQTCALPISTKDQGRTRDQGLRTKDYQPSVALGSSDGHYPSPEPVGFQKINRKPSCAVRGSSEIGRASCRERV